MKRATPKAAIRRTETGWLAALFLVAITFLAYQPVWHAGFIWDDDNFLLNNPLIRQGNGLSQFWFSTTAPDYFPMTSTTLWLEWRLWGERPLGYHLVNVLLHALSSVLLWKVLSKLTIPLPWFVAALFALHPVNVESVAWITERKNTLAMFFYMASLLAYLKFEDGRGKRFYVASLTLFTCALLSKTAVVMLPLVLLGIAWWRRGSINRVDFVRTVPFFLASLFLGLVTVWFQYHRAIGPEIVRADGILSRLAVAGWAVWFYLYKAVLPVNLMFVYPRWSIDATNILSYVPLLVAAIGLGLCWKFRKRWGRPWFAALAYFVIMLLPVLGFLNIYFMRYSLVADHWQYFAVIGPVALVGAGVGSLRSRLTSNPLVPPACGAVLLLTCGIMTWHQAGMYRHAETLWRKTVERNPGSAMAYNCLGDDLLQQQRYDEAIVCFRKSLDIEPNDPLVHNNLAMALLRQGQEKEAVSVLERSLAIEPRNGEPHNNLAWLLATCPIDSLRNGGRSVELALQANALAGRNNAMFIDTLAAAYAEAGQFDRAIATAEEALELAVNRKDIALIETLRESIAMYRSGSPIRDHTLLPPAH